MSRKNKAAQVHIPELYASRSEVGNVREHNEDSFVASSPLFVVADGMGGHEAGEVASEIAIQTMVANAPETPDAEALAHAACLANEAVLQGAMDGTGRPGMGTTLTAAAIFDDELVIAQVGDSRAYLMHDGTLQRITRDHSLVADLVAQGRITEQEARVHPQRSVITRALGSDPHMQPDTYHLRVEDGDLLLLCSDGLSSMLDDAAIAAILAANPEPQAACDALVDEALAAGGLDNVTAIVIDPFAPAPEADEGDVPHEADAKAAKRKRTGSKAPLIWLIALLLVVAAVCGGVYAYANNTYYVQSEQDGTQVVLYRGLPGSLMGLSLSWEEQRIELDTSQLAPTVASHLEEGISVDSLQDGQELLAEYEQTVAETLAEAEAVEQAASESTATGSASSEAD